MAAWWETIGYTLRDRGPELRAALAWAARSWLRAAGAEAGWEQGPPAPWVPPSPGPHPTEDRSPGPGTRSQRRARTANEQSALPR